jgi:hypothetical protein
MAQNGWTSQIHEKVDKAGNKRYVYCHHCDNWLLITQSPWQRSHAIKQCLQAEHARKCAAHHGGTGGIQPAQHYVGHQTH